MGILNIKNMDIADSFVNRFLIANAIGKNDITEVSDGVLRVETSGNYIFFPGQYCICIKKDGCTDVTADMCISDVVTISNVSGGELTVNDRVIECDMECKI